MSSSAKATFDRSACIVGAFVKSMRSSLLALTALVVSTGAAHAQGTNRLEKIDASVGASNQVELRLQLSDAAPQPLAFVVDNPARISLDLPDTTVALPSRRIDVKRGGLDTVNVAEAGGRTRVVLNLDSIVPYETRVEGNVLFVTLGKAGQPQATTTTTTASTAVSHSAGAPGVSDARQIRNVDFRRGADGAGRILVQLSDSKVSADLRQEGGRIVVDFSKTSIPDTLLRRLDVMDFATPVNTVDAVRSGNSTRLVIAAHGDYEQVAYQSDNLYTIEVKPVLSKVGNGSLADKKEYTGERLTLNFQDIETRAVLQLLADTSGQNMVISDTVQGNVTLRLQNVPWDQALDIVLQTKGLDKRRDGNVILVAPAAELAQREKAIAAAQKDLAEVSPVRTEYLQVNYAKAADLAALMKGKGNSLLSDRGSVAIDERTNTLLLQDTSERLADIRRLVSTLDVPIRQVLIEARIVIVNEDFSRDLGARLGFTGVRTNGSSGLYTVTGTAAGTDSIVSSGLDNFSKTGSPFPVALPSGDAASNRYQVNLPVANPAGSLALGILGKDFLVDLELSAAQAEGRGEIVSQPKIIAVNQRESTIEQGTEIPYQESSSSGATTTQFKKAVLSLKVTPQITPDSKVILDLTVAKDAVGQNVPSATGGFVPSIDTRKLTTQVILGNGETVVLGGVLETEKRETDKKVPLLGDIPVLGYLFKTTSKVNNKTELLIFITPKILKEGLRAD